MCWVIRSPNSDPATPGGKPSHHLVRKSHWEEKLEPCSYEPSHWSLIRTAILISSNQESVRKGTQCKRDVLYYSSCNFANGIMAQILRGFALSLNQKLMPVSQLTQTLIPTQNDVFFPIPQPKDQTTVQFHHMIGFYKDGSKWSDLHRWSCTDSVSYRITKTF